MNVSVVFLFLFTSYSTLFLMFHIWLFSALDVPYSFLGRQTEETGITELFKQARTRGMEEVYWCWWGHRQGPIGHLFCLVAGLGGWIGVSDFVLFLVAGISEIAGVGGHIVHRLMELYCFCVLFDYTISLYPTTVRTVRQYRPVWEKIARM